MSESKQYRLSEVLNYIKGLIDSNLSSKKFWLKAEISNISSSRGHNYLDLVENSEGKTIAQCRATIWSYQVQNIKSELQNDYENILKKGAEVLCMVDVQFDLVYGLSINIVRVDRYFALGMLEQKKQETLNRLQNEHLLEKNKQHQLPIVIQNIAIIGSVGTSGHTDLVKQLVNNEYGYHFNLTYFNCQVQGEKAEFEIIEKLKGLENSEYDAIALVRGGGSKLDLEVFNSYNIAQTIAFHSKPIITGIGHETDISVADIVAHIFFKTPSAVGSFFVNRLHNYENQVLSSYREIMNTFEIFMQRQEHRFRQNSIQFQNLSVTYTQRKRGTLHNSANRIISLVRDKISNAKQFNNVSEQIIKNVSVYNISNKRARVNEISQLIKLQSEQIVSSSKRNLEHHKQLLSLYAKSKITQESDYLISTMKLIELYHPDKTLERGYSITRNNGHQIRDSKQVSAGDTVDIELSTLKISAKVISVDQKESKWKTLITKMLQRN